MRKTKVCFKCGRRKPLASFYLHPKMADGHLNKCKACARVDVNRNYAAKRPAKHAYDRLRYQRPERRAKMAEYNRSRRKRDPLKYKARTAVGNALRDGRLKRQPCEGCGAEKVQAHHSDYRSPLDVKWLCFKCHREREHGQCVTAA